MKERPIIFNGPMVRAILSGTKTQTRRVLKPDGKYRLDVVCPADGGPPRCHYGHPGDRLWVRETWQGPLIDEELEEEFYQSSDYFKKSAFCTYRATGSLDAINADGEELGWRPPLHMPRWASRITLEITDVRVERLKDISEADAIAEGVQGYPFRPEDGWPICTGYMVGDDDGKTTLHPKPQDPYRLLWESINGPGSWNADPWVWVIEFKRI